MGVGVPARAIYLLLWLLVSAAGSLRAADARPIAGPGATKEAVIDAYGWPTGQSISGTKEILNYPQGQVTLENGRVEKLDFSTKQPWPAPRPRPGPPTATTVKKPEAPVDFWLSKYEDAVNEARRRRARILVLFSGPDWSPGSKQFQTDVEFHPDFVNAFTADFVFLRLEFATRSPIAPELREQNSRLRELYGVTTYPALMVISASGTLVGAVDLMKAQEGDTYRARVIAAVREIRDLLASRPLEPAAPAAAPAVADGAPSAPRPSVGEVALGSSLLAARWLVLCAIGGGGAVALGLFWLVWRKRKPRAAPVSRSTIAARISDAASGLPSAAELLAWPKARVCALVAALAEADGYAAALEPAGGDKDVVLRRAGEPQPQVLVCCAAGSAGVVPAKRVRELLGTLTADGVGTGWFVAPAGFSTDARMYAAQHNIRLFDHDGLLAQLRDLPPLLLPKVLARLG